tara:strand:- start:307 stop:549 length:243 start_codon:yes stop_codon:yes gene_type:complete
MARHKILKDRLNKEAEKLGEFTTEQLLNILNNYPNHNGFGETFLQTSTPRLANLLHANPNIIVKERWINHYKPTIWKWKE